MLKYSFALIKQRLETEVPELKEVAWDTGQGKRTQKGTLLISPGSYIKFQAVDTKDELRGIQNGTLSFEVRTLSDCLKDGDHRIIDGTTETHLDLVDKVYKSLTGYGALLSDLQGFESLKDTANDRKVFNSISRTRIVPDNGNGAIMETTQTFQMFARDYVATKIWQKVVKELEIKNLTISR